MQQVCKEKEKVYLMKSRSFLIEERTSVEQAKGLKKLLWVWRLIL